MTSFFEYTAGTTLLHRAHPLAKLLLAFSVIIAAFLTDKLYVLGALCIIILATSVSCGLFSQLKSLLSALIGLSLVMLIIQCALNRHGDALALFITNLGLITGARAALRLWCFALPLVCCFALTRLEDLANCVVMYLHVPYTYVFTLMTAIRFVPIFSSEMKHITDVQTARGVEFDTTNPLKKLKLMMPLIVPLLVVSVRKADMIALAAQQRGFYLRQAHSCSKTYPVHLCDALLVSVGCCLIITAILI